MINEIETQKNKRILITSTDVMMLQFLVQHVFYLKEKGFDVEVVCSEVEGHVKELKEIFNDKVVLNIIESVRSPFSLKNFLGYKQLKKIIKNGNYDIIWTNEPVMGVLTRFAAKNARKNGTKILYVAHGFHFYKGAPLKNWLIFYPIEKFMSHFTDKMITINSEDQYFAEKHFKYCLPEMFNGIGVNTDKFTNADIDTMQKRIELGVPQDCILFVSVGELEKRKNHFSVITAFAKADIKDAYLLICGVGSQREKLEKLIKRLNVGDNIQLLGYRYDIKELLATADVFVLGSYQEGLSVAIMEAMSMQKLCVISRIRGNVDLIGEEDGILFKPKDIASIKNALQVAAKDKNNYFDKNLFNARKIKKFDSEIVTKKMFETINALIK